MNLMFAYNFLHEKHEVNTENCKKLNPTAQKYIKIHTSTNYFISPMVMNSTHPYPVLQLLP